MVGMDTASPLVAQRLGGAHSRMTKPAEPKGGKSVDRRLLNEGTPCAPRQRQATPDRAGLQGQGEARTQGRRRANPPGWSGKHARPASAKMGGGGRSLRRVFSRQRPSGDARPVAIEVISNTGMITSARAVSI